MRNFGKRSGQGPSVIIAMRATARYVASIHLFPFFTVMAVCGGRNPKSRLLKKVKKY
jgi:hypothetical protein